MVFLKDVGHTDVDTAGYVIQIGLYFSPYCHFLIDVFCICKAYCVCWRGVICICKALCVC